MYSKIENGSTVNIQGLDCHVPPAGYVYNVFTDEFEYRGVFKRDPESHLQYWEGETMPQPADLIKRCKVEKAKQEKNPEFIDMELEEFRAQEWDRRLNGFWFYNKGVPVYLTGLHYFYLRWWKIDIGWCKFRIPDLEYFYFLQYCIEDPNCLGMLEITKRRFGKCFAKNTKIRMYDGTVKMVQDVANGDIVMGNDSTKRVVYGATTGKEDMYAIIPNRGNEFVCNASHILTLKWNGSEKQNYKGWKKGDTINISVIEYLQLKDWEKDHLVLYRAGWGKHFKEVNHSLPPYMLGLYLGDGCCTTGAITSADPEVVDYFTNYLKTLDLSVKKIGKYSYGAIKCTGYNKMPLTVTTENGVMSFDSIMEAKKHFGEPYNNGGGLKKSIFYKKYKVEMTGSYTNLYRDRLREIGVLKNKHIPSDYLIDSCNNRLELLAGLIDTDGYFNGTAYEITQKRELLANQIAELAQSLGFYATVKAKIATMKREDGTVYRCTVYRVSLGGDVYKIPCKIKRKQGSYSKQRVDQTCTGFKVEKRGAGEYFGFAVDNNHLFLLADGTVVHNTYRAGLFAYEYASRTADANAGIQSKTNTDAKKFFAKAIVRPFRKLPPFFRPEFDTSGGINPKKELRFQQGNIRGKNAEQLLEKAELGSVIDFESSELLAYDGQKEHRYVRDEFAKTFEVNVYDGLDVVRYCLMDDEGRIIGKALYTSTVEIEEEGKKGKTKKAMSVSDQAAKALWDESDPMVKINGRTKSGLYRFFMPSYRARCFDIYGYPNETEAKKQILSDWEVAKDNPKRLAKLKRKEPMTIQHAFGESGVNSHFDPEILKGRIEILSYNKAIVERGNFYWKDGIPYSKVEWIRDEFTGRWTRCWDFAEPSMTNNFEQRGNLYYPKNSVQFVSACDPYQNDVTEENRNSKAGSHVFMRYDNNKAESNFSNAFVCQYQARPKMVSLFYDDMVKQSFYYGTQLLYESNKPGIKQHFLDKGLEPFLIKIPGYKDYGIPATPENKMLLVNLFEEYVVNSGSKLYFLNHCEQLLKFDVNDTEKYDLVMSSGWTLVANYYRRHQLQPAKEVNITDFFRTFKTGS